MIATMRPLLAWFLVMVSIMSGGCAVEHRVVVSARDLYATIPERRARGEASVVATDATEEVARETRVTIKRGASLKLTDGKMRLEELERGCKGGSVVRLVTPEIPAMAAKATTPATTATPEATATPAPAPTTTAAVPTTTDIPRSPTTPVAAAAAAVAAEVAAADAAVAADAAPIPPPVLVADPAEPDCPLLQYADSQFEVGRYDQIKPPPVGAIITGVVLAGLGGAAVCEFACAEDSTEKQASDITLIAAGSLLAGALIWAFIDCAGRWGQPGCRD